jgi:hypothetical protein
MPGARLMLNHIQPLVPGKGREAERKRRAEPDAWFDPPALTKRLVITG